VVLYGLVDITFPHHDLEVRLQVSNLVAAARFARALGAGEAGRARAREKQMGTVASARTALGVEDGASMSEISATYKKMARAYHPDKVLELPPEVRELSEWRMKEISAAYTLLKRHMSNPVDALRR
jgi:DnaJ like chaperone protein